MCIRDSDTHALGVTLGQQAKPGDVCTLVGDLGEIGRAHV